MWSLADKVDSMKDPDPPTEQIQMQVIVKNKVASIKLRLQWRTKRWKYTLNQSVAVKLGRPPVGRKDGFVSECCCQPAHPCPCPRP